jgi:hypothetical protein
MRLAGRWPLRITQLTERTHDRLMLLADQLLDNLTGRMTAQQIAERTGISVRDTVLALCTLWEEGRVLRRVDVEGPPIARWTRLSAAAHRQLGRSAVTA